MYLNKQLVVDYIEDMVKIYTDIHQLSEQGGVGIGDSSKYLGKIQALIEFKHYLNSGRFDDIFIKNLNQVVEEYDITLRKLADLPPTDSVKIWIDNLKKL